MDNTCISRFFFSYEATPKISPPKIPASQNSDDSQEDLSQNSIDLSQNSIDLSQNSIDLSQNSIDLSQNSIDLSQNSIDLSRNSIDLNLSQLAIEEQDLEPLNIPAFYNITLREKPISPHCVIEEEFSYNPWAMLIATIFLTKTHGKTARRYMQGFFQLYPTPYEVLADNPTNLERFFDTLGLRKRGHMIWKLTYQFVSSKWRRASDLCGIGKYGEDAYRIFCLGHTDVDPGDRYLKLYLDWLVCHTDFLEHTGVLDSECVIEDPILKYYSITLRDVQ